MKVQFEAEALIEYQDAAYYAEDHFGSGANFVAAMRDALDTIAADPTRFQAIGRASAETVQMSFIFQTPEGFSVTSRGYRELAGDTPGTPTA